MKMRYLPFLLLLVLAGCTKVKDPEFRRIEKFGLRKLGLQEATIGFHVTYFNPNNFGVTVKEAAADIYLDSVYLGKFTQEKTVEVRKNADFSIPFTGSISLQTALNLKMEDLTNRDVLLRADGTVKVGKAGVFVNKPIRYEGRHKLELKF